MKVNDLLPNEYQSQQREISQGLVKKWKKTGLLEGLDRETDQSTVAVLLENQARQLVTEANQTGTSQNSEEWAGVALPLVRRIFAEIAAKELVSVQPMNLPSGLVFYLDYKYGTSKTPFDANSGRTSQEDSVFGVTDADRGAVAPSKGLYGAGRFGYTINNVTTSAATLGAAVTSVRTGSITLGATNNIFDGGGAVSETELSYFTNFNAEFSASRLNASTTYAVVAVPTSSLSQPDVEGVRGFSISGTGIKEVYPEFTKIDSTKGSILFLVSGSGIQSVVTTYQKQPSDITRGDFEDGATQTSSTIGDDLAIPELNLELRSEPIVAKTRKLKAVWTPEFAQDLNAYHSIDAEAELTSLLSEYISQEIDLEILDMLIENAQTIDRWSAKIGYEYDAASRTFVQSNATAQAYNQGTWFQTLGTKIQKVSNKIHQLTLRGGANFMVVSPTVATILESIPGFASTYDGSDKMQYAMGVQKVGMLNSRYTVYKNPYMLENAILVGFRGAQFLETGAVYSPYIPLIMTPLVYDPLNFTPRKGVMTRYAKKMLRPEFYGKIYVDALTTI